MLTIYHNPRCGTSRKVLDALQAAGLEPDIVLYMETGWTEAQLRRLEAKTGAAIHALLRGKEPMAQELGLGAASEDAVRAAMIAHPVLVERPIVETDVQAVLARPAERIDALVQELARSRHA